MKRRILIILIVLLSSLCYAQVTNYPLHNFLMLQPVQENEKLCLTNCSIEIKVDEGEYAFISCTTTNQRKTVELILFFMKHLIPYKKQVSRDLMDINHPYIAIIK